MYSILNEQIEKEETGMPYRILQGISGVHGADKYFFFLFSNSENEKTTDLKDRTHISIHGNVQIVSGETTTSLQWNITQWIY
jgi:hypothetical protein